MTNAELKTTLEAMLQGGKVDQETIAILQDASIHAAMLVGVDLEAIDLAYTMMVMVHKFMGSILGLEAGAGSLGAKQPSLADLFGGQPTGATPEEKDKLNKILGDMHIDLP